MDHRDATTAPRRLPALRLALPLGGAFLLTMVQQLGCSSSPSDATGSDGGLARTDSGVILGDSGQPSDGGSGGGDSSEPSDGGGAESSRPSDGGDGSDSGAKDGGGSGLDAGPAPYVYSNGVLNMTDWPFDYSFGSPVEKFKDTTDPEPGHTYDLNMSGGGWQPAAAGYATPPYGLDLSPYTYMTFDINPQTTQSPYDIAWHYIGDINGGTTDFAASAYVPDITEWAGAVPESKWTTVQLPMAIFGVLGSVHSYKFFLRNNGGSGAFLLDNVSFVAGSYAWVYAGDSGPISGWADASTHGTANYAFQPTDFSASLVSLNGSVAPGTSATSKNVVKLSATSAGGTLRLNYGGGFGLGSYDHLTFGAVPTKSGYSYRVQLYDNSGAAVGSAVDPSAYAGHDWGVSTQYWTTYVIPLSAFGAIGSSIGGLAIEDASGATTNTLYYSAIGFYK
jgi:hypothetical protein